LLGFVRVGVLQAIAKQIGIIDEDKYASGKAIVIKGTRPTLCSTCA
jgi:hypothetical protein